ncbi:MAG TPA: hypothetical protein VGD65_04620 [Chryseosolibacter sp.]
MSVTAYFFIVYVQTFLSGLIAAAALYKYKQRDFVIRLIGILYLLSFICNVAAFIIWKSPWRHLLNVPGSIYDLGFVIICAIIFNHVFDNKYKHLFILVIVIYLIGSFLNLFLIQKLFITSFTKFSGSLMVIVFAVTFFYRLLIEMPTMHLHRLPMFWFNSGFLIFCSGALFLYAFTDYLVRVLDDDLRMYWSFHNLLFIVMDVLMLIGIRYDWLARHAKVSVKD